MLDVWLAEGLEASTVVEEIVAAAGAARVPVRRVSRARLEAEARTEAPQGVLAHARPLPDADLDDLCAAGGGTTPFLVALDGVSDPRNLGALVRTAEAAGATGAVLPRRRGAAVTPAAAKAAAGAVEWLPFAVVSGIPSALERCRALGLWVLGLAGDGPERVEDMTLACEPLVLVLGSEGRGLSRLVRQRCDQVLRIPMAGRTASLNVAAAGALACFEVARRRAASGGKVERARDLGNTQD